MKKMKSAIFSISALLVAALAAYADESASALRMSYDFPAAVAKAEAALEGADSLSLPALEEELMLCRNGLEMMNFCTHPEVISKYVFPIAEFHLYYPLEDRCWRPVPNQLDSVADESLVRAIYFPEDAHCVYYSACDAVGSRNLYRSEFRDTLWSAPALINETVTSSYNEIYPMLSPDGKSLFFASEGLFGMGGYDLYVSHWDESIQDWGVPQNMGFPYSSPYDDFLFINTPDGKYSIFASNRECSSDSVCVYVLEQDVNPVHGRIDDVERLRELAALSPEGNASIATHARSSALPQNGKVAEYLDKLSYVRSLRDSISACNDRMNSMRERLSSVSGEDASSLRKEILNMELSLPRGKAKLDEAVRELQKTEMEFLANGIVIDPEKIRRESDRQAVGTDSGFTFKKHEEGPALDIRVEVPVPEFDYSFKILEEGQFADDNTLPEGLVYQIQLFSLSRKAVLKDIKGLSPVFERISSQRYVYSVGLFRTYSEVLKHLNSVKKQGFRNCIIVAFQDGKPLGVNTARKLESKVKTIYKVRINPPDGKSLPDMAKTVVGQMCASSDIVRLMDGAAVVFDVSPIDERNRAEELVAALKAAGISSCEVLEAGQTRVE